MKAAVFYGKGTSLKIEEGPVPEIGQDEILVKVAGCGICQSDMEYIDLGVPTMKKPPLILGHESAGTVSEIGESVTNVKVGDPVLLGNIISCGSCLNCREGRDNICDNWQMLGNHISGKISVQPLITGKFPLSEDNQALDVMRKGESIRNILVPRSNL